MNEQEMKEYLNSSANIGGEPNTRIRKDVVESIKAANATPMTTDEKRDMIANFKKRAAAVRDRDAEAASK